MVSKESGISEIVSGEDVCWVDWDNDGKLDMGIGEEGKFRIWKNAHPSWENHWTEIKSFLFTPSHCALEILTSF